MIDYDYSDLIVERDGAILRVTLNRPHRLNATTHHMNAEVLDLFRKVDHDPDVRVVVITGSGRAFCAGGDLFEHDEFVGDQFEREMRVHTETIFSMLNCSKPLICQMNGPAIGWGATLGLFCDIILADETAKIADPHVHLGLSTGDGAAIIFPQLVGYPRAKLMLMTGEPITGRQANEWGLVTEALPAEQVGPRVTEIAKKIASMPTHAMRNTKASVNIPLKKLVQDMMDTCIAYEVATQKSEEHAEALKAFAARRQKQSA
jgi:enoyl-CoA hydratase